MSELNCVSLSDGVPEIVVLLLVWRHVPAPVKALILTVDTELPVSLSASALREETSVIAIAAPTASVVLTV